MSVCFSGELGGGLSGAGVAARSRAPATCSGGWLANYIIFYKKLAVKKGGAAKHDRMCVMR